MDTPHTQKRRVIIVGAGFVGLPVARKLMRAKQTDLEVVLIDAKDSFLFTPRLIDILEDGGGHGHNFQSRLDAIAVHEGFTFVQGRVTHIDRAQRLIHLTSTTKEIPLSYDILLLCQGAKTNFYNIPGVEEHALPLKTFEDVERIHTTINTCIREAHQATNATKRRLLSVVVVGGGATGIEGICALKNYLENKIQEIDPSLAPFATLTLIQSAPQLLPGFPPTLVSGVVRELRRQGIHILLGETVQAVENNFIKTASGQTIPSSVILWAAGIRPNLVDIFPPAATDPQGYLITDSSLRIDPSIFAAGDIVTFRDHNVTVPKNAQTSLLMADILATNILRTFKSIEPRSFHYTSKGSILVLGKTGFLDAKLFSLQSRLMTYLRDLLYRLRFHQIVGSQTVTKNR